MDSEDGTATVLIVDDAPQSLKMMFDYLEANGYRVRIASDGYRALDSIEVDPPHLIILDVTMPGIDGFETCRRLKTSSSTKDIPVIFMTASSATEDKIKGFNLGAVDYITKPVVPAEALARIKTHLKIQQLARQLAQANTSKDRLFGIIAHDLRGPFMPMLGHLEILTECVASGQTGTDVSEMAHYALNSGQKIFALLENLLQWAKAQMGGIECNPTVLDLHEEAARVLDLILPGATAKEISLSIQDTTDGQRKVYADRNLLNVVLRNLFSNAIKFTRRGGQVTISATRRGTKFIEVAISDTGVGIKAADKAKLLQSGPHFTTIGTGGERGSGLGLALCKEMVERNGGRLSIDSVVEQGTTVRFTVPIASTVNKPVHSRSSRHTSRVAERQASMHASLTSS